MKERASTTKVPSKHHKGTVVLAHILTERRKRSVNSQPASVAPKRVIPRSQSLSSCVCLQMGLRACPQLSPNSFSPSPDGRVKGRRSKTLSPHTQVATAINWQSVLGDKPPLFYFPCSWKGPYQDIRKPRAKGLPDSLK